MRLSETDRVIIKEEFAGIFDSAKIYLFGSRTDDNKKGGDIDLLILSDKKYGFKILDKFNTALIRKLGDQKIDILSYTLNDKSPFLQLVMEEAIEL